MLLNDIIISLWYAIISSMLLAMPQKELIMLRVLIGDILFTGDELFHFGILFLPVQLLAYSIFLRKIHFLMIGILLGLGRL